MSGDVYILLAERGHPGPAALRGTRVEIQIQDRHKSLVAIHLVDFHIGMIGLYFVGRHEPQPVQVGSQGKHAFDDILQLEVWFQILGVEVEKILLLLFGIIGKIPALQVVFEALRTGVGVERLHLALGERQRDLPQLVEQVVHVRTILGHTVVECILGVVVVAEQLGQLFATAQDALDVLAVVELAAEGLVAGVHKHLLTQLAVVGILKDGGGTRGGQVEDIAFKALSLSSLLGHCQLAFGKTIETSHIRDVHIPTVRGGQGVLSKGQCQVGEFHRQLVETFLLLRSQVRPIIEKGVVRTLHQHLVRTHKRVELVLMHVFDTGEQVLIQIDAVGILSKHRLHLISDLLHFRGGVALQDVEEDAGHAVEQLAGAVERHDGVQERGRFGIVFNLLNILLGSGNAVLEGREIVLESYLGERGRLVRCVPLEGKRVVILRKGDNGHRGHALAIARKAHPFVGLCLDGDLVGIHFQDGGQCLHHLIDVGAHFWLLQYKRAVHVVDVPAFEIQHLHHFAKQDFTVGILVGLVGVGEMGAYILEGGGAEQGVA